MIVGRPPRPSIHVLLPSYCGQGWFLNDIEVPALVAWIDKCRGKESVAGTVKDPASFVERYKKFLGPTYLERAGAAKK